MNINCSDNFYKNRELFILSNLKKIAIFDFPYDFSILLNCMSLGYYAFAYCSFLTQVALTSGLKVIGDYMFYIGGGATTLRSITIPSSIISVGRLVKFYVFSSCIALQAIEIEY